MKGAKEYAELFGKSVVWGKLFLRVGGNVTKGKTFRIYVLCGDATVWADEEAIEVYGNITAGKPTLVVEFGWLRQGKWVKDFEEIVAKQRKKLADEKHNLKIAKEIQAKKEEDRINKLLSDY